MVEKFAKLIPQHLKDSAKYLCIDENKIDKCKKHYYYKKCYMLGVDDECYGQREPTFTKSIYFEKKYYGDGDIRSYKDCIIVNEQDEAFPYTKRFNNDSEASKKYIKVKNLSNKDIMFTDHTDYHKMIIESPDGYFINIEMISNLNDEFILNNKNDLKKIMLCKVLHKYDIVAINQCMKKYGVCFDFE